MAEPRPLPSVGRLTVALPLVPPEPVPAAAVGNAVRSGTLERALPTVVVVGSMALLLVAVIGGPLLVRLRGRPVGPIPPILAGAGLSLLPALAGHGFRLPGQPVGLLAPLVVAGTVGGALFWLLALRANWKGNRDQ